MVTPPLLLAAAVGLVLGALIGFAIARNRAAAQQELEKTRGQDEASRILKRAETEAENARKAGELAGREEGFRLREAWEKEESRRRDDLERAERRAEERSDTLDRQIERINARDEELEERSAGLKAREEALESTDREVAEREGEAQRRLEALAGLTAEEAKTD